MGARAANATMIAAFVAARAIRCLPSQKRGSVSISSCQLVAPRIQRGIGRGPASDGMVVRMPESPN